MVFENEAERPSVQYRPSVQTFPRYPTSVNAMKQRCVIVILAYFTLIPNQFALKTLLKHSIVHFLTLDFSKQNGFGCVLSKVITD